jgi:hypothetical protein
MREKNVAEPSSVFDVDCGTPPRSRSTVKPLRKSVQVIDRSAAARRAS